MCFWMPDHSFCVRVAQAKLKLLTMVARHFSCEGCPADNWRYEKKNTWFWNARCQFLCEGCTTENEMCKKPMVSRNRRSVSHAICGTGRHWVGCTWLGGGLVDPGAQKSWG